MQIRKFEVSQRGTSFRFWASERVATVRIVTFEIGGSLVDVIKKAGVLRRSRAEPSNLSAGGDSLMGSGSEDEDEDGSAHHHHHDSTVRGAHLGTHNIGSGGPGDQTVGHGGELPLGGDPCKQEDSEDQGES